MGLERDSRTPRISGFHHRKESQSDFSIASGVADAVFLIQVDFNRAWMMAESGVSPT
jgi:hypothetical protein